MPNAVPSLEEFAANVDAKRRAEVVQKYAELIDKFAKSLGYGFRVIGHDDPDNESIAYIWEIHTSWWGTEESGDMKLIFGKDRDLGYILEHLPEELVEMWFKRHG